MSKPLLVVSTDRHYTIINLKFNTVLRTKRNVGFRSKTIDLAVVTVVRFTNNVNIKTKVVAVNLCLYLRDIDAAV